MGAQKKKPPVRIRMVEGLRLELTDGGAQEYRQGEHYLVDVQVAEKWLEQDLAVDPESVPECPDCGTPFEGRRALEAHRALVHRPEAPPAMEEQEPTAEPLDETDSRVAELLQLHSKDVEALAHELGVGTGDVKPTGHGGRIVKADWIRAVLRARGEI